VLDVWLLIHVRHVSQRDVSTKETPNKFWESSLLLSLAPHIKWPLNV